VDEIAEQRFWSMVDTVAGSFETFGAYVCTTELCCGSMLRTRWRTWLTSTGLQPVLAIRQVHFAWRTDGLVGRSVASR
jgi:7-keto-8-aminopelargonate synthetase-like enzyme